MDPLRMLSPEASEWSLPQNNVPTPIYHDIIGFDGQQESSTVQHSNGETSYNSFVQPFGLAQNQSNGLAVDRAFLPNAMELDDQPSNNNGILPAAVLEKSEGSSRRLKYRRLDWDRYQDRLRQLYLEENLTLTETIKIMKEEHGFDAS